MPDNFYVIVEHTSIDDKHDQSHKSAPICKHQTVPKHSELKLKRNFLWSEQNFPMSQVFDLRSVEEKIRAIEDQSQAIK
jgi:hypothetical protein